MRILFLPLILLFSLANTTSDRIDELLEAGQEDEAFATAQTASEAGDSKAHEWMGWFYENGTGVETNLGKAAFHFRIAALDEHDYARWRLGVMIDQSQAEGTLEDAVSLFKGCASNDYPNCIVSLAVMHATGRGTEQSYASAMDSYMRAARMGDHGGIRGVGVMFANGEGVEADLDEALAWILLSAVLGNEMSQSNLQALMDGDEPPADVRDLIVRAREIAETLEIEAPLMVAADDLPADKVK